MKTRAIDGRNKPKHRRNGKPAVFFRAFRNSDKKECCEECYRECCRKKASKYAVFTEFATFENEKTTEKKIALKRAKQRAQHSPRHKGDKRATFENVGEHLFD